MAEGKLNIDLKSIAVVIGVVGALASSFGGYAVLQYRVDQLEDKITNLETTPTSDKEVVAKIEEIKCFVAKLHNQTVPGCA